MKAYVGLQQGELAMEALGYTATRHQREVGAGYFDQVAHRDLRGNRVHPGPRRQHGAGAVLVQ